MIRTLEKFVRQRITSFISQHRQILGRHFKSTYICPDIRETSAYYRLWWLNNERICIQRYSSKREFQLCQWSDFTMSSLLCFRDYYDSVLSAENIKYAAGHCHCCYPQILLSAFYGPFPILAVAHYCIWNIRRTFPLSMFDNRESHFGIANRSISFYSIFSSVKWKDVQAERKILDERFLIFDKHFYEASHLIWSHDYCKMSNTMVFILTLARNTRDLTVNGNVVICFSIKSRFGLL